MSDEHNKATSLLHRLKENAARQAHYGGESGPLEPRMGLVDCPQCGAGRAQQDGLTHCAYCGFEFMAVTLTDGLHIKKTDN